MGVDFQNGGPDKDRTCDLLHAMQALSQLSYRPINYYLIIITVFGGICNFFYKPSYLSITYYTKKEPRFPGVL